jgi:hypothetical protein
VVPKSELPATRCTGVFQGDGLQSFEVWSSSTLPLGVAKISARVQGLPPFELALDSYGHDFKTNVNETLDAVRAMQNE